MFYYKKKYKKQTFKINYLGPEANCTTKEEREMENL